tara:strand:- start:298 stop:975 length:678 start_codon:yes stop_codon:yes gene_type:complete
MINVNCVYYGSKYAPIYVQNLYNMVNRHLTVPYQFICWTDHVNLKDLVKGDILYKTFRRHDFDGWWNKLQLFAPESKLNGVNFYLDLDVVILQNIDCFVNWGNDETFGVIRDFGQPDTFFNSSIMKWNNLIASSKIWDPYITNRSRWRRLQGDQNVVSECMKGDPHIKVYPDEWTQSYKWFDRSQKRFHKNKWTFEKAPEAKIAVFHGLPNPHESTQEWVKNNWK